jgi:hypothetical protein
MKTQTAPKPRIHRTKHEMLKGYLYARLHALGSKSEGPLYYLQLRSGKEVLVLKKVRPWENDPVLHPWLGQQVCVFGKDCRVEMGETIRPGIEYTWLSNHDDPLKMQFRLGLKDNTLWVDKQPSPHSSFPPEMKKMKVGLSLQWPYRKDADAKRSVWSGTAPTSQLYDFWIEDPKGQTIWQWSKSMWFRNKPTEVHVEGGSPHEVRIPWFYFEEALTEPGIYVVRARFIPSDQEIRMAFNVKFAH